MMTVERIFTMSPEGLMLLAEYLSHQGRLSELEIVLDRLENKYDIQIEDFLEGRL